MCNICVASKKPVENSTPIFRQLTIEYQAKGLPLPWRFIVKPTGTIGILSETSRGMNPTFDWMVGRGRNSGQEFRTY